MASLKQIPVTDPALVVETYDPPSNMRLKLAKYYPEYKVLNAQGQVLELAGIRVDERQFFLTLEGMGTVTVGPGITDEFGGFTDRAGMQNREAYAEMDVIRVFFVVQDGTEVPLRSNRIHVRWEPGWGAVETTQNSQFQNLPTPENMDPPPGTIAIQDSLSTN